MWWLVGKATLVACINFGRSEACCATPVKQMGPALALACVVKRVG